MQYDIAHYSLFRVFAFLKGFLLYGEDIMLSFALGSGVPFMFGAGVDGMYVYARKVLYIVWYE